MVGTSVFDENEKPARCMRLLVVQVHLLCDIVARQEEVIGLAGQGDQNRHQDEQINVGVFHWI